MSAPQRFRKKPVVIEAMRFTTNNAPDDSPLDEIVTWVVGGGMSCWHDSTAIFIDTLEGTMRADVGDWIIRGVQGEFYPCKPDIFEATYEPAEPAPGSPVEPETPAPSEPTAAEWEATGATRSESGSWAWLDEDGYLVGRAFELEGGWVVQAATSSNSVGFDITRHCDSDDPAREALEFVVACQVAPLLPAPAVSPVAPEATEPPSEDATDA
jgi:hypothetical protein